MDNFVKISNLSCKYDPRKTDGISNLNLSIQKGKVLSLIGPSGSGKTTTLKCLAGFTSPNSGEIIFSEKVKISYVDQYPNLDEEKTVYENLESDILDEISDEEKRSNQIRTTLAFLEITNEIHSLVKNISGGQKQRVIIAKALVHNPTLLLLDEPFANLDKILRTQILNELFELLLEKGITVVWVTHNTEEALAYSDRVALLNFGKLMQVGPPQDLYHRPANLFTAQFFNEVNLIPAKLLHISNDQLSVKFFAKEYNLNRPNTFKTNDNDDVLVVIRPESLIIDPASKLKGEITKKTFLGSRTLIEFKFKDSFLVMEVSSLEVPASKHINFSFDPEQLFCLSEV